MSNSHSIEIWKQIPGYGLHYEASSLGRIRVKDRIIIKRNAKTGIPTENKYKSKVLTPSQNDKWGHLGVTLGVSGVDYSVSVHKLVLLAFHGESPEGMEACHNNGIASDNRPTNLRWDTHYENNQDRKKHGTYATGQDHHMSKISNVDANIVKESELSTNDLSTLFGLSKSRIQRIRYSDGKEKVEGYEEKVSIQRHISGIAKLKGVTWDKSTNSWKASISIGGGKSKHLGRYKTEIDAHNAYLNALTAARP